MTKICHIFLISVVAFDSLRSKKSVAVGLLGGQRLRLYQANLDRLFNPKDDLSLAFFKKLTIAKNCTKPKLLHKTFGADPLITLVAVTHSPYRMSQGHATLVKALATPKMVQDFFTVLNC